MGQANVAGGFKLAAVMIYIIADVVGVAAVVVAVAVVLVARFDL